MQDLHLVGFTTDRRHLIFSARRGAKSGSFLVPVDEELVSVVAELGADPTPVEDDEAVEETVAPPPPRVEAKLTVREVQARLRAGESVAEVASDAGVAEEWVERFAPPVRAEQRQVVERALRLPMERARAGESAKPLGMAVASAMAERGVVFTDESFAASWTSRLIGQDHWVIEFHFTQRGRKRTVGWTFDAADGRITTTDRTASQLGFVAPPPAKSTVTSTGKKSSASASTSSAVDADDERPAQGPRSTRGDGRPDTVQSTKAVAAAVASTKKALASRPAAAKKQAAAAKRAAAAKKQEEEAAKKAAEKKAAPKKAKKKAAPKKKTVPRKAAKKKAAPKKTAAKKTAAPKKTAASEEPQEKAAPEQSATENEARTTEASAKQVTDERQTPAENASDTVAVERSAVVAPTPDTQSTDAPERPADEDGPTGGETPHDVVDGEDDVTAETSSDGDDGAEVDDSSDREQASDAATVDSDAAEEDDLAHVGDTGSVRVIPAVADGAAPDNDNRVRVRRADPAETPDEMPRRTARPTAAFRSGAAVRASSVQTTTASPSPAGAGAPARTTEAGPESATETARPSPATDAAERPNGRRPRRTRQLRAR